MSSAGKKRGSVGTDAVGFMMSASYLMTNRGSATSTCVCVVVAARVSFFFFFTCVCVESMFLFVFSMGCRRMHCDCRS